MKKEKVADIYHQECLRRREIHAITPDSYIEDCFILSTRTINLLKRHRIRTIGHLIKIRSIFDVNFAGAGMKTIAEILDASRRARKELAANDSTRASN
jgi:DNA-directed RNA polymerase alpha subunit